MIFLGGDWTNALDVCNCLDVVVPREGLDLNDHGGIIVRFIEILAQIRKAKSMNRKRTPKSPFPSRRKLRLPPLTPPPPKLRCWYLRDNFLDLGHGTEKRDHNPMGPRIQSPFNHPPLLIRDPHKGTHPIRRNISNTFMHLRVGNVAVFIVDEDPRDPRDTGDCAGN
jgi:hypothetical protein